jgi:peroxiredoxin
MKYLLLAIIAAAFFLAACSQGMPPASSDMLGRLNLPDPEGRPVGFSEHLGKDVVLVSFWATFCKPCKNEMPFLQRLHEEYAAKGLYVLAISSDGPDSEAQVLPFLQRNGYTFPVVVDRSSEAGTLLNPKGGLPHLIVFDRSGREVLRQDGVLPGEQYQLEAFLKGLL